jgi:hypothetical protein
MAYAAFDLDQTLGFFEIVGPLAFLWSKDFLSNPEQSANNSSVRISRKLELQLARARESFARSLLGDPKLLFTVLRPDITEIIRPLLKSDHFKSAIIYSNTGVSYTVELGKFLIEKYCKAPNFFSLTADHWHPLRDEDRTGQFEEPKKTIGTLQKLFRRAAHIRKDVPVENILFVDDRNPKHLLAEQEKDGLTYLNIHPFVPSITDKQRENILFLAIAALDKHGLLKSSEYLESGFCHRTIPYDFTKQHTIRGFRELLNFVKTAMFEVEVEPTPWREGVTYMRKTMQEYLDQGTF